MTTITVRVEGMRCGGCGLLIDDTLEDLPGVLRAETCVRDGVSTVQFDPDRCRPDQLITAIAEAGYTARVVQP